MSRLTLSRAARALAAGVLAVSAGGALAPWVPAAHALAATDSLPRICFEPDSLVFVAIQGGAPPAGQTFTIRNCGADALEWQIVDSLPEWMTVEPLSGYGNAVICTVVLGHTALAIGSYDLPIEVISSNASNSPQRMSVVYRITSPLARLCLDPARLTFEATVGGPLPAAQAVSVANCGAGVLDWYATENLDWLKIKVLSGGGHLDTLAVSVTRTNLLAGIYRGPVTVVGSNADNSPQRVDITYLVTNPPSDSDALYVVPPYVLASAEEDAKFGLTLMLDHRTPAHALTIPLSFQGANANLRVDTTIRDGDHTGVTQKALGASGVWSIRTTLVDNVQQTILLGYVAFGPGLPPSHDSLVTIHFDLGRGGPSALHRLDQTLLPPFNTLTLIDSAAGEITPRWSPAAIYIGSLAGDALLCVSPDTLFFRAMQGGTAPPAQPLFISSCGGGVIDFAVLESIPWLSVWPAAGLGDSAIVLATVSQTDLPTGAYSGRLEISSIAAANSPRDVAVAYEVGTTPVEDRLRLSPARITLPGNVDTAFALSLMLTNQTTAASLAIPLSFAGANTKLRIDTTVSDGFGNAGLTQGPLGADSSVWTVRTVLVDQTAQTILLGYVSFDAGLPPSADRLVDIHFDLDRDGGDAVHVVDSVFLPPANRLRIVDPSALEVTPFWDRATIVIAGTDGGPRLCVDTDSLRYQAERNGPLPPPQTFAVARCGPGALYWTAQSNVGWLDLDPTSGSDSALITASVNTTALAAGVHRGIIRIDADSAGAEWQEVQVSYTVQAPPAPPQDYLFLLPGTLTLPSDVDTAFSITVMLHLETIDAIAITLPLTFAGSGPQLAIDTTVADAFGHPGVTHGPLGADPAWDSRTVTIDHLKQTILIGYLDFGGRILAAPQHDSLVTIHFKLAATGVPTVVRIDTTTIPPANVLSILDPWANTPPVGWTGGTISTGTVGAPDRGATPELPHLGPNYPNPFNAGTRIAFSLARTAEVQLVVFNSLGQRVRLLADGVLPAGAHAAWWDGRAENGNQAASGTYFCRLRVGRDLELTRAMTLLR